MKFVFMNNILFSSKNEVWETPHDLFNSLNKLYQFTLDPCANRENANCEKYYTIEDNGLLQSWKGERVFCNPPYGRNIGSWIRKCYDEVMLNDCELVVLLVPARTDTAWFHDYIYNKFDIEFLRGRLTFSCVGRAPFPSMIVIMTKSPY